MKSRLFYASFYPKEGKVLEMADENEKVLTETLERAVTIVSTVDERYRDAAFPIILQSLVGALTNSSHTSKTFGQRQPEVSKLPSNVSVNEFFRKAKPDTHVARFVCAAYYLLHASNIEQFTITEIMELYGKLREPKPKNSSDVMSQCIKKTYIIDGHTAGDKQKTWVITPEGEKFVEGFLNDNTSNNNGSSR